MRESKFSWKGLSMILLAVIAALLLTQIVTVSKLPNPVQPLPVVKHDTIYFPKSWEIEHNWGDDLDSMAIIIPDTSTSNVVKPQISIITQ